MPKFKVAHDYASSYAGPFAAGATVEVDAEVAEWVNRDSPGTLVDVSPRTAKEEGVRAPSSPPSDRQVKGRSRRGAAG